MNAVHDIINTGVFILQVALQLGLCLILGGLDGDCKERY